MEVNRFMSVRKALNPLGCLQYGETLDSHESDQTSPGNFSRLEPPNKSPLQCQRPIVLRIILN